MPGKTIETSSGVSLPTIAEKVFLLLTALASGFPSGALNAQEPVAVASGDVDARAGVGGLGRYITNRWSVVKATISNFSDTSASSLVVVTPSDSGGLQYARQVEVPAQVAFDAIWPVRLAGAVSPGTVEFQYLHFPGGEDDGVIRHEQHDRQIPTFSGITRNGPVGLTGWIVEAGDVPQSDTGMHFLIRAMRFNKHNDQNILSFPARDINERRECLDPLDQLTISDPQLHRYPQACEAIRKWVQNGGRLLIQLDRTGREAAEILLGESLPLTIVGAASSNTIQLDLNPDYQENQYPVRVVNREFDEPVDYLQVVPGAGETMWSVDGWPVAVRVPIGNGIAVVTAISPDVFIERKTDTAEGSPPYSLIPSSRRMLESLFSPRTPPLLEEPAAARYAAAMVGYEIPSQRTALLLLVIFPVVLIALGILLQRRAVGERLIWILPTLAIVTAAPAIAMGIHTRSVAPTTIIETIAIQSAPGASEVASEGFATIFVPGTTDLLVASQTGTVFDVRAEAANLDYRRLVWTGADTNAWKNLSQPAGSKTLPIHGVVRLESPLQAIATFDENGLQGKLLTAGLSNPHDPIFSGDSPDRMSLIMNSAGEFRGGVAEVLAPGQFLNASFISEEQRFRSALLESVFSKKDRLDAFPAAPAVLFWAESKEPGLIIGNEGVRRMQSILVVHPLRMVPPEAGRTITIPPPLLPYRSVRTAKGGSSGV